MPAQKTWLASVLEQIAKAIVALPPAPPEEQQYPRDEALAYLATAIGAAYRNKVDVKVLAALLREHGIRASARRIKALATGAEAEPAAMKPHTRKSKPGRVAAAKEAPVDAPQAATPLPSVTHRFTPAQDRADV